VIEGIVDRDVAADASSNKHDFLVALGYAEQAKAAGVDHRASGAAIVAPREQEEADKDEFALRLA
jgi:hypothetical protein